MKKILSIGTCLVFLLPGCMSTKVPTKTSTDTNYLTDQPKVIPSSLNIQLSNSFENSTRDEYLLYPKVTKNKIREFVNQYRMEDAEESLVTLEKSIKLYECFNSLIVFNKLLINAMATSPTLPTFNERDYRSDILQWRIRLAQHFSKYEIAIEGAIEKILQFEDVNPNNKDVQKIYQKAVSLFDFYKQYNVNLLTSSSLEKDMLGIIRAQENFYNILNQLQFLLIPKYIDASKINLNKQHREELSEFILSQYELDIRNCVEQLLNLGNAKKLLQCSANRLEIMIYFILNDSFYLLGVD